MPTETWAVAYGPSRNGPQQIAFLDAILVLLHSLEPAKTAKQKQSSQKRVAEGSQILFSAVFTDYAELPAQDQSKS